ncbi:hypothetical protein XM82_004549 [Salmonella enterica subsp. enterica serovar Haifa]|nr:hypothetical protein [Salmonella enterica subsp. enterica serovar Haifa]
MTQLSFILSALVGGLLITTGIFKLREPRDQFAESISAFRVLPASFARPVAAVLPPLEIGVGVCVVAGVVGPWAYLSAGLIAIYTASVVSVMVRGISTECGCFGSVLRSQASGIVVARNVAFMVALVPSLIFPAVLIPHAWAGVAIMLIGTAVGIARLVGARNRQGS